MLKLEQSTADKQITLIFRKKSYFFTYSFLIAFGLALSFHLLFFIVFQIVPIKLHHSDVIFPPVAVETNIDSQNLTLVLDADPRQVVSNLPPLELSTPTLPNKPPMLAVQQMEYGKEDTESLNLFNGIEVGAYQPVFNPLVKKTLPPLNVIVSGPLATKQLLSNGLAQIAQIPLPKPSQGHDARLVYNVIADGHTGRICWYEAKELTSIASFNRLGDELLKNMLFAPDQTGFMTNGEVEIHLNGRNS